MKDIEHDSVDQFSTTKYLIKIKYRIQGIVTVMDIVGALFGQTEGLMNDLELRELQKSGRIGRIQVKNTNENGVSTGEIIIPSSLDRVETAILSATIESVDRVGPCAAEMRLAEIKDIREDKRKQIMDRATELLQKWEQKTPESHEMSDSILEKIRAGEVIQYGPDKLYAGEDIDKSDQIIIVEGIADVKNMMRAGFRNAIATNGTHVPQTIIDLSKKKSCIAFVDGDRGGEMILEELIQVADIDYVAIAPKGVMVEELTRKEIIKHLQNKKTLQEYLAQKKKTDRKSGGMSGKFSKNSANINKTSSQKLNYNNPSAQYNEMSENNQSINPPKKQNKVNMKASFRGKKSNHVKSGAYKSNKKQLWGRNKKAPQKSLQQAKKNQHSQNNKIMKPEDPKILEYLKSIIASNEALGLNKNLEKVFRVGNTQVFSTLDKADNVSILMLDGVVTQRLLDKVLEKNIETIYAINRQNNLKIPSDKKIKIKLIKDYVN
ncbi:MAG: DNA primase DnaG [Promethearchaeota archaeon]